MQSERSKFKVTGGHHISSLQLKSRPELETEISNSQTKICDKLKSKMLLSCLCFVYGVFVVWRF